MYMATSLNRIQLKKILIAQQFYCLMNNPENQVVNLNFTNLFKNTKISDLDAKKSYLVSPKISGYVSPRQHISHRTPTFIPKCPYGRAASVNSKRNPQKQDQNESFSIFSVHAVQSKSQSQMSRSMNFKQQKRSPNQSPLKKKSKHIKNISFSSFKADKFEVFKLEQKLSAQLSIQQKNVDWSIKEEKLKPINIFLNSEQSIIKPKQQQLKDKMKARKGKQFINEIGKIDKLNNQIFKLKDQHVRIRGLKVRTGSEVKKNKNTIGECDVSIQGQTIKAKNSK